MPKDEEAQDKVDLGKLPDYLGYQVRQAQTAVFKDFAAITERVGMTPGEFSLLTVVAANSGINQNQLARIYDLDKSTLSWSIKKLKERDLVSSQRRQNDRRYFSLVLTPNGEHALRRATLEVEKQEKAMDGVLDTGERQVLLRLLKKIPGAFK